MSKLTDQMKAPPKLTDAEAMAAIRAAAWFRDTKALGEIILRSRMTHAQAWRAYVLSLDH